jgi:hypothetical protein
MTTPIPTRAELRASFAEASGYSNSKYSNFNDLAHGIRAAVEVVLGDPASDTLRPTTARHRAQFLALADAIEGNA